MSPRRLIASSLLTAAAVAIAVLWVTILWPRSETTEAPLVQAQVPAATATPAGVRLVIPSIAVDAPVVSYGIDADGNMATPDGPSEVAWYDFTPRPGSPGNAVMAGHLNWRDGTVAVFATLAPGDAIDFVDEAGKAVHYRVVSIEEIDALTADSDSVINWTEAESLTLITCSGEFLWTASSYATRTIVRAERVPDAA